MPQATRSGQITSRVGLLDVPDDVRTRITLGEPDYIDLFTVATATATEHSAETWARAILEEAPVSRRGPRVLWRLLGLRLGPRNSSEYVQGWEIAARGDNWLRVETGSWYMTAQAVCLVEESQVSISLALRYDRAVAALVWRLVSGPHQRGVPVMLRQAVRLIEQRA